LKYDFNFEKRRTFTIYSPNGVMKTSLANTFKDITRGQDSKDCIFPECISKRTVIDKNETEIKIFEEKYQKNPFIYWKNNLSRDTSMLIAAIPFVRNIAEFTG